MGLVDALPVVAVLALFIFTVTMGTYQRELPSWCVIWGALEAMNTDAASEDMRNEPTILIRQARAATSIHGKCETYL